MARGLRPSAIRRRSRKGHPSQPRRPSGWLGAHAWTPPSRPPIQERGPRRRPPQNLEIERAADRNTPIFIGLQLLQEPLMCVLKSTKSPYCSGRGGSVSRRQTAETESYREHRRPNSLNQALRPERAGSSLPRLRPILSDGSCQVAQAHHMPTSGLKSRESTGRIRGMDRCGHQPTGIQHS